MVFFLFFDLNCCTISYNISCKKLFLGRPWSVPWKPFFFSFSFFDFVDFFDFSIFLDFIDFVFFDFFDFIDFSIFYVPFLLLFFFFGKNRSFLTVFLNWRF